MIRCLIKKQSTFVRSFIRLILADKLEDKIKNVLKDKKCHFYFNFLNFRICCHQSLVGEGGVLMLKTIGKSIRVKLGEKILTKETPMGQ